MRRWSSIRPLNLLCLSSRARGAGGCGCGRVEFSVDVSSEVALEAAADLSGCSSFGAAAFDVGAGAGIHAHACDRCHVECLVETAISPGVDAVALCVAGGCWDRACPGEAGEGGFGADASGM